MSVSDHSSGTMAVLPTTIAETRDLHVNSWLSWRGGAVMCGAAQFITLAALTSTSPIPVTWAALLLVIAPVPLALATAFSPPAIARLLAPLTILVLLVAGIAEAAHIGAFFLPAAIALSFVSARLWREAR